MNFRTHLFMVIKHNRRQAAKTAAISISPPLPNDYFGARYFASTLGRFRSADPFNPILRFQTRSQLEAFLAQPQNWNEYAHTWNNPLLHTDPNGESVYVVLYTEGNSKGDTQLMRAAQTKASSIEGSHGFDSKKDTVLLRGVTTKADVANAFKAANDLGKTYGGVQQLNMFSHSGALDGPVLHDPNLAGNGNPNGATQFTASELKSLPALNWNQGAIANFYGCNTTDFAGNFADAQHVKSFGTSGTAYFSSRPDRLSPDGGGNLYLNDTWFNQHLVPGNMNPTASMDEHDPQ